MTSTTHTDPTAYGPPGSGPARREGVVLLTLAVLQFVSIVDFMIVMPLGPQLLADLDIDAARFSWVVSAYTLAAVIAGFLAAVMMLVVTHLPAAGIAGAATVVALLMATNSSRMVTAMSLITSSIEPRRRGSFMSVNSSVQHVASGLGTMLAGLIVEGGAGEPLRHFGTVGILAAVANVASLWVAARIRPLD